jgi:hypothetical protein
MHHTFCEPADPARVAMAELSFRPDIRLPGGSIRVSINTEIAGIADVVLQIIENSASCRVSKFNAKQYYYHG